MLRETGTQPRRSPDGDCDCGILKDIVAGLDKVVNDGEDAEVIEEGAEDAPGGEEEGGEEGGEMSPVEGR